MNTLPVVIDETGYYHLRGGGKAHIHLVQSHIDDLTVTRFNCKGHTLIKNKNGKIKRTYSIWHQSGHFLAVGDSPRDIVRKA